MFLNGPVGSQSVCRNTQNEVVYIIMGSEASQSKREPAVRLAQIFTQSITRIHNLLY